VLASESPRRREILQSLGIRFRVRPSGIAEQILPDEAPEPAAARLAREKAQAAAALAGGAAVLSADTIVLLGSAVFGKPRGDREARSMLERLSGRWHDVITAVCLLGPASVAGVRDGKGIGDRRSMLQRTCRSRVLFAPLSRSEIDWYISTGEHRDKAGAYAVQGMGARFIEAIDGSFTNVMGLPARTVYEMLLEAGLEGLVMGPAGGRG
jgi:nucleoside triphosphate pyrophosphatase